MKRLMSHLVLFLIVLAGSVHAQVLVDSFGDIPSGDISARLDQFVGQTIKKNDSKLVVIVKVTDLQERLGNLSSFIKGTSEYMSMAKVPPGRRHIVVTKGESRIEFWDYPIEVEPPKGVDLNAILDNVTLPILFAENCYQCGSHVPLLSKNFVDFELLASYLKRNRDVRLRASLPLLASKRNKQEDSADRAIGEATDILSGLIRSEHEIAPDQIIFETKLAKELWDKTVYILERIPLE